MLNFIVEKWFTDKVILTLAYFCFFGSIIFVMATKLTNRGNKTSKMFSKRLKLTKNGKLLGRKPGIGHFNARQSRARQLAGKVPQEFVMSNKDRARFLPYGTTS